MDGAVVAKVDGSKQHPTEHEHGAETEPPEADGAKTRGNHSKQAIKILKEWLFSDEHVAHPYPTEDQKAELMKQTGLNKKQLSNWFVYII